MRADFIWAEVFQALTDEDIAPFGLNRDVGKLLLERAQGLLFALVAQGGDNQFCWLLCQHQARDGAARQAKSAENQDLFALDNRHCLSYPPVSRLGVA